MRGELEAFRLDFMPKKANLLYHIISAEWYSNWRKYAGYLGPGDEQSQREGLPPVDPDSEASANGSRAHPGPINNEQQLAKLCVPSESFLHFNDDPINNRSLLPGTAIEEDVDYYLLNESCFKYLYRIYGGTDIRRVSIEVP